MRWFLIGVLFAASILVGINTAHSAESAPEIRPPSGDQPSTVEPECKFPIDLPALENMPKLTIAGFALMTEETVPKPAAQVVFHDVEQVIVVTFIITPTGLEPVTVIVHHTSGLYSAWADEGYFDERLRLRTHPGKPCSWRTIGRKLTF